MGRVAGAAAQGCAKRSVRGKSAHRLAVPAVAGGLLQGVLAQVNVAAVAAGAFVHNLDGHAALLAAHLGAAGGVAGELGPLSGAFLSYAAGAAGGPWLRGLEWSAPQLGMQQRRRKAAMAARRLWQCLTARRCGARR